MHDLPPAAVDLALGLVGAVRDGHRSDVDRILGHHACRQINDVIVALAAMVDDTKTRRELLAWTKEAGRGAEWRASLTDDECRVWHAAWVDGDRDPAAVDGHREWHKRNRQRQRARRERQERERAALHGSPAAQAAARAAIEEAEQRAREAA